MVKHLSVLAVTFLGGMTLMAQLPPVTGDRSSPLQTLTVAGENNIGVRNAVMRNQSDVRVLRVVVEPGGTRVTHAHDDVKFHMFIPISAPMQLEVEGQQPVNVAPWHPFYMPKGTRHGFHNTSASPVEILEVFVK